MAPERKRRIAVVLFNLGGPDRPEAVAPFLFNLFNDRAIIDLPAILLQTGPKLERLVSAAEIRKSTTIPQLIDRLDIALRTHPA